MNKNISINISGIIFHIEEDGYDLLKNYLDSVHSYFASFDGSDEIIADIEARAAELFMTKLKTDKQIITAEDVQTLIKTLGSIKDFQALEEEGAGSASESKNQESGQSTSYQTAQSPKKLQRDMKRKMLGGVAAGLANYLGFEPLWMRIVFILMFFASGFGLLVYAVLWIAVPGSYDLEEDAKLKKLYRNPDKKVLAGVASGLAAYFNTDLAVIRILFVVTTFFGGLGLITYLIFWIITPEANTITEKMKMQGEPVTLSNIENRVKKEFNAIDREESAFMKILLFPFRAIAAIFNFLGKILGPLFTFIGEAIRVVFGLFLTGMGLVFLVATLIAAAVLLGLYTGSDWFQTGGIPVDLIIYSVPMPIALAAFVLIFIPALALTLGGISVLSKTNVVHRAVGFSMLFFWIASVVIIALFIPSTIGDFKRESKIIETDNLNLNGKTLVIKAAELGEDNQWSTKDDNGSEILVNLKIKVSEDSTLKLVKEYESFGTSIQNAEENARMVTYNYQLNDSVLILNDKIDFKAGALFRFQHLQLTLYVPRNTPFMIDESVSDMLESYPYYLNQSGMWMFNDTEFTCLDCPEGSVSNNYFNGDTTSYEGFTSVNVGHFFDVTITRGPNHQFKMDGTHELAQYAEIHQEGNVLYIEMEENHHWIKDHLNDMDRRIKVNIEMPILEEIEASGAVKVSLNDFKQDNMNIELSGASNLQATNLTIQYLELDIDGASEATLSGSGTDFNADLDGASKLNGSNFLVKAAVIDASGASRARVNASKNLKVSASGASNVSYLGNPNVDSDRSGISDIDKE